MRFPCRVPPLAIHHIQIHLPAPLPPLACFSGVEATPTCWEFVAAAVREQASAPPPTFTP